MPVRLLFGQQPSVALQLFFDRLEFRTSASPFADVVGQLILLSANVVGAELHFLFEEFEPSFPRLMVFLLAGPLTIPGFAFEIERATIGRESLARSLPVAALLFELVSLLAQFSFSVL
jgi:hypothetical protein